MNRRYRLYKRKIPALLSVCVLAMAAAYSQCAYAQGAAANTDGVDSPPRISLEAYQAQLAMQGGGNFPAPMLLPQHSNYTLGPKDVIEVNVGRHPEVSGTYVINSEGNIQYEFVGDISVEGLTKNDLLEVLKDELSSYIVSPELSVKILAYNSKVVYVIGEVGRPGRIFMNGDSITVRDALLEAGLLLTTADPKKSTVITPAMSGESYKLKVNVYALLYEGDLSQNYILEPGDTLFVPPTRMAKVMRAIRPFAEPIGTVAGTGRSVMFGF